jgi:hypothetical protein
VTPSDATDARHLHCWYSRRSARLPADLGFHTIEDGLLVYCAHPVMFPVVGYHFDIRNCDGCESYRAVMPRKDQVRR